MTQKSTTLTLVSYNTQYCTGRDGKVDIARIAREVEGADLICLQEIDRHWARTGDVDQVAELCALFPQYYAIYGPAVDVDASLEDPSTGHVTNRRCQFGNMILSRWPIRLSRNHMLPKLYLHDQPSLQRAALEVFIDLPDGPCRVFSTHLGHSAASERHMQIAHLLELVQTGAHDGGAISGKGVPDFWETRLAPGGTCLRTIVAGDMNSSPDSDEYAQLCGVIDPHEGLLHSHDGLLDAWALAGQDPLDGITCDDDILGGRIDHVFVTSLLADKVIASRIDTEADGSDHQPVWVEFSL